MQGLMLKTKSILQVFRVNIKADKLQTNMLNHNLQLANCLMLIKMVMIVWSDFYQGNKELRHPNTTCLAKFHTVVYRIMDYFRNKFSYNPC